jgi:hypothetical protein
MRRLSLLACQFPELPRHLRGLASDPDMAIALLRWTPVGISVSGNAVPFPSAPFPGIDAHDCNIIGDTVVARPGQWQPPPAIRIVRGALEIR